MFDSALDTGKVIVTPFQSGFHVAYKDDFDAKYYARSFPEPPSMFDLDPGYTLHDEGEDENDGFVIRCAKCGFDVNFDIDGSFAFSTTDGMQDGHLQIINHEPMVFDVQIGLTRVAKIATD